MKYIIRLSVIALALLVLTGCGGKSEQQDEMVGIDEATAGIEQMEALDDGTFQTTDNNEKDNITDLGLNNEQPQQVSQLETEVAPKSDTSNVLPVSTLSNIKGTKSEVASENTPNLAQVIEANRPTETQLVANNKPTEAQIRAQERQETLGLIRRHEGFRSKPYWDVNAWRVGYGQDTINGQRVHRGMNISRNTAEDALSNRYYGRERPAVIRQLGVKNFESLKPEQRAVLGSLQWNYGHVPPRVVRAVNSGNCSATASAIRSLRTHDGYINAHRRDDEANIYGNAC